MARKSSKIIPEIPEAADDATALEKGDVAVAKAVAPYEEAPAVQAVALVGKLGDQPPMRVISGAVLAAGIISGERRLMRAGLRMLAAHTLATAAKNFVKQRVDRTRPELLVKEGRYKMKPGRNQAKDQTSFPSGHTAGAVAVGRAFARDHPELAWPSNGAAAVISLAQIPRCAHYPTDVGAGIAIGLASEAIVSFIAGLPRRLSRAGGPPDRALQP